MISIAIFGSISFSYTDVVDFNTLFDQHGSIMLIIDPETGNLLYANEAASKFYGYSRTHITSLNIDDINVLTANEIATEMKNAIDESRNYFKFKHQTSNGEIKDVEVYSYPYTINGKSALFSIIHDVTTKATLERNNKLMMLALFVMLILIIVVLMTHQYILRKKNKSLTLIKNQIENFNALRTEFINADNRLIYLKDEHLKYVFVNTAMEKFYGKPSTEFIGKSDYSISPNQFADVKTSHDQEVLIQNKEICKEVFWNKRIYNAVKFPIRMLNGTTGVGAYIEDVTEHKKTQLEIERNLKRNKLLVDALSQNFETKEDIYRVMLIHSAELTNSDAGVLYASYAPESNIAEFEYSQDHNSITPSFMSMEAFELKLSRIKKQFVTHIPVGKKRFIIVSLSKKNGEFDMCDVDQINILIKSMHSIIDKSTFSF
jgi:PAS domain S-box-containing protein